MFTVSPLSPPMMARSANSAGAQLAIFNTPELLSLIFNASTPVDCARLVSTSRTIFTAASSVVWKYLDGVGPLLKLLQATSTKDGGVEVFILPYASIADFSRFDVYAPLVKTLRVHPEDGGPISVSPWRTLVLRTHDGPLLPSLSSLIFESSPDSYDSQLMWISVLACSSLRSIETIYDFRPDGAQISFSTMSIISKLIIERCLSLHTLALFPGVRTFHRPNKFVRIGEEDDEEQYALSLMLGKPFHHYLGNMHNLRFLTTNTTLINPTPLLSLSKLPFLESLDICAVSERYKPTGVLEVSLPEGSFPALKHLAARFLDTTELLMIWNMLPIVQNLTRLELQFNYIHADQPDSCVMWFSSNFFPLVCNRSLHLTDLTISLGQGDSETDEPYELSLGFFEQMAHLPLQNVSLGWLVSSEADVQTFYARLGAIWPGVVNLKFTEEYVQLDYLQYFTALPKLECLIVSFDCPRDWSPPILGPELPAHSSLPLHTLGIESYIADNIPTDYAKPLAKYLLSFWPNLRHFTAPILGYSATKTTFQLMENYISKVKTLEEIRKRITAQYGPEAAEAMVPSGFED
ncbi:hypothetical protein BDV93DRAFT_522462 [Ceratobasidium sp. AG-I]|nr:hypothetical protein BDV93DRAFT_522462 [Ceratobasidium sp. AG-I]